MGCRKEGNERPDPAKEGMVRQDSMIPPAAHPRALICRWHKVTCPGTCCSLPAPLVPALAASPTLQLPRFLTLSPLTKPCPWTGPWGEGEAGSYTAPSHRDRLPGDAPPPQGEQVEEEEEERCRSTAPGSTGGVSLVWLLCWGLFVCWFSQRLSRKHNAG